ncbi:MAG TPA: MarR family transcriptional regulator [bacterium]|nr:MarR family transcriptional regulator [bacterium]
MKSSFSNYLRYEKVRFYLDVLLFAQRNLAKEVKATVGISLKETKFLLQVNECPGASLTKIQNFQHMPTSSAAWVADRLVAKGLIDRRQNPGNRREVILDLTDEGTRILKRIEQVFFTTDVEKRLAAVDEKIIHDIEKGLATLCELYGVDIKQ